MFDKATFTTDPEQEKAWNTPIMGLFIPPNRRERIAQIKATNEIGFILRRIDDDFELEIINKDTLKKIVLINVNDAFIVRGHENTPLNNER